MTTTRQPRQPAGPLRIYTPSSGATPDASGVVVRKQITLLTDQQVIADNMPVQQLVEYGTQLTELTTRIFEECLVKCEMLLEITFSSSSPPELAVFSDGKVPEQLVDMLYAQSGLLPRVATREAQVHIQFLFAINPQSVTTH